MNAVTHKRHLLTLHSPAFKGVDMSSSKVQLLARSPS